MDKEIRAKFQGGREVIGVLKGYDQLQNLVLDEVREEPTGKWELLFRPLVRERALLVLMSFPVSQREGRVGSWAWWF